MINVHSTSTHPLGCKLTLTAKIPFTHSEYGRFQSILGVQLYLESETEAERDKCRNIFGVYAMKRFLRTRKIVRIVSDLNYEEILKESYRQVLKQNEQLRKAFLASEEPFIMAKKTKLNDVVVNHWLPSFLNKLRIEIKAENIHD